MVPELPYYNIICVRVNGYNVGQRLLLTRGDVDNSFIGGMVTKTSVNNGFAYWGGFVLVQGQGNNTLITQNNGADTPVRRYEPLGGQPYVNLPVSHIYGVL